MGQPPAALAGLWPAPRCMHCLQDPFAERTIYNDSPLEKVFIRLFTQKIADQLGPGQYSNGPSELQHTAHAVHGVLHAL